MEVYINGFRCYQKSKYKFRKTEHYLISGESGCGKSTIFAAITWCLYGNVKNINNYLTPNDKIVVIVKTETHTVTRRRNTPEYGSSRLLEVSVVGNKEKIYGETAQYEINRNFGDLSLWMATSYIGQGKINPIFTSTGNEKMDLLCKLSFLKQNPGKYINLASEKIKECQTSIKVSETVVGKLEKSFETFVKKNRVESKYHTENDELKKMKKSLKEKEKELVELEKEIAEIQSSESKRLVIGKILDSKMTDLETIEEIDEEKLELEEAEYKKRVHWESQKKELSNLRKEFLARGYGEKEEFVEEYTEEDYEKSIRLHQEYRQNKKLCHPIEYRQDAIAEAISKIRHDLMLHEKKRLSDQYGCLQKEAKKLRNMINAIVEKDISYDEIRKYSDEELEKVRSIEAKVETAKRLCKKYDIEYSRTAVDQKIGELEEEIKLCELYETWKKIKSVEDQIEKDMSSFVEIAAEDEDKSVEELNKEIYMMDISKECLTCPNCQHLLRLCGKKLEISESTVPWDKEKYDRLKKSISGMKKNMVLVEKIDKLEEQLKELKGDNVSELPENYKPRNLQTIKKTLGDIRRDFERVKFYSDPDVSSERMVTINKVSLQIDSLKSVEEQLSEFETKYSPNRYVFTDEEMVDVEKLEEVGKLEKLLEKLENKVVFVELEGIPKPEEIRKCIDHNSYWKRYKEKLDEFEKIEEPKDVEISMINISRQMLVERNALVKEVEKLRKELESVEDLSTVLKEKNKLAIEEKNQLKKITEYIRKAKLANTAADLEAEMLKEKKTLRKLHRRLQDLELLKNIFVEDECAIVGSAVDYINSYISSNIGKLFTGDISANLKLHRALKKGGEKQQVNFSITHNGGNNIDISSLSDGERARINLLVTVAFGKLNDSKFLILDESLSCLDETNKYNCLDFIEQQLPETTVVMVCHDIKPRGNLKLIKFDNGQILEE